MTVPTRVELASWKPGRIEQAASDLDDVRNAYLDSVGLAKSSPDRADFTWSGLAAEACRERLLEETESARKFAAELEDVADSLRGISRRLEHAKRFAETTAANIESDPHHLAVRENWEVNISPMTLIPTPETNPERVRQAIIEKQEEMDTAVRFLVEEDTACATLVEEAMARALHYGRRLDQEAAFERVAGRLPETDNDWLTASMLDTISEADKYLGTEARIVMGHIRPEPGRGVVRTELFIPVYSVFNVGLLPLGLEYDLGDLREASPTPIPGDARVELIIDYDNGLVVGRQNPSVTESGDVRVDAPTIEVEQLSTGDVRIAYEAVNPFAPVGAGLFHKVEGEVAVSPDGDGIRVGGVIGKYPSFELYHHRTDGTVVPLVVEDAQDRSSGGPLWNLPQRHGIGDASLLEPFEVSSNPQSDPHGAALGLVSRPGETRLGPVEQDIRVPIVPPSPGGR